MDDRQPRVTGAGPEPRTALTEFLARWVNDATAADQAEALLASGLLATLSASAPASELDGTTTPEVAGPRAALLDAAVRRVAATRAIGAAQHLRGSAREEALNQARLDRLNADHDLNSAAAAYGRAALVHQKQSAPSMEVRP